MRVGIAASGIGHVFRGMEGWAESLAVELSKRGIDVKLFKGARPKKKQYEVCLPCMKRSARITKTLAKLNSIGGWRVGLGSPGQIEAWSYGLFLLWHLRKGFDLVHIKQGNLAVFLRLAQKVGLLRIPFIFANGQIVKPSFISRFKIIQFLSPYEKKQMKEALGGSRYWFVIPNFVDTDKFAPLPREKCRRELNIPLNSFVVLTVGAIKKYHKRMDYFISEMNHLKSQVSMPLHVIIAGSREEDTESLIKMGKEHLGDSLSVFIDVPKDQMPIIYNTADIFTLCSLKEAFGNVNIEAMSCGISVVHHCYPVAKWIISDAGEGVDLTPERALSDVLRSYMNKPGLISQKGKIARRRAVDIFSKEIVASKTVEMYERVMDG